MTVRTMLADALVRVALLLTGQDFAGKTIYVVVLDDTKDADRLRRKLRDDFGIQTNGRNM